MLFGHLDFENYISITQKQLSDATKIGQSHISESLKRLEEQGIVAKEKKGNRNVYKLNTSYAWKGKISSFQNEEKDRKKREASEAKIVQIKQRMTAENAQQPPSN